MAAQDDTYPSYIRRSTRVPPSYVKAAVMAQCLELEWVHLMCVVKHSLRVRGLEELFFQLCCPISFWFWREIGFGLHTYVFMYGV